MLAPLFHAARETFRNECTRKYVVCDGLVVEMAEYNVQIEPPEKRR